VLCFFMLFRTVKKEHRGRARPMRLLDECETV
jgi:hypothetical protein